MPRLSFFAAVLAIALSGAACKVRRSESEAKVLYGIKAADWKKAIVKTFAVTNSTGALAVGATMLPCTGTFLNSTVLITAAHCVVDSIAGKMGSVVISGAPGTMIVSRRIILADEGFRSIYAAAEAARFREGPEVTRFVANDFALVEFPSGTGQALGLTSTDYLRIAPPNFPVTVGQRVYLAGFGALVPGSSPLGERDRHWGGNRLASVASNELRIRSTNPRDVENQALMGSHDSGGPLFDRSDATTIVGIASNGSVDVTESTYANVRSATAIALYDRAATLGMEAFPYNGSNAPQTTSPAAVSSPSLPATNAVSIRCEGTGSAVRVVRTSDGSSVASAISNFTNETDRRTCDESVAAARNNVVCLVGMHNDAEFGFMVRISDGEQMQSPPRPPGQPLALRWDHKFPGANLNECFRSARESTANNVCVRERTTGYYTKFTIDSLAEGPLLRTYEECKESIQ